MMIVPGDELIGYFCVRSIRVAIRQPPGPAPELVLISSAQSPFAYPITIFVLRLTVLLAINEPLLISTDKA